MNTTAPPEAIKQETKIGFAINKWTGEVRAIQDIPINKIKELPVKSFPPKRCKKCYGRGYTAKGIKGLIICKCIVMPFVPDDGPKGGYKPKHRIWGKRRKR